MKARQLIAAVLVAAGLAAAPCVAAAQDSAALIDLAYLAQSDQAAAIQAAEAALATAAEAPDPDLRLIRDLLGLRAELIASLAGPGEAAAALEELAAFLVRHRARLEDDPAIVLRDAAVAYEAAGDLRGARRMLTALRDAEYDAGQAAESLARVEDEIARLADRAGNTDAAAEARRAADALRQANVSGATRGDQEGFRQVDVYYATDRARTGRADPRRFYGHGRGELDLGIAAVTIPNTHVPGRIETPKIWKLEFGPSPAKHVILKSVEPLGMQEFYARLGDEFIQHPDREAFVFVHGYNVTFEAAAKRAAQIAYDMDFAGVPVLYSWPSRGSALWYGSDAAVVRLSGRRLADFLESLAQRSGARQLHIVAHSMGNRALTDALEILALRNGIGPGDDPLFGQVLFAAPDVDAGLFARMVDTFRPIAERLTLYASENDWALVSSRKLHGDAPRAGQGGVDLLADGNLDSIDMSALGEDMLAHSYFADDSSAIADMMTLFWQNPPPGRRCGLIERASSAAPVWDYAAGRCATRDLIGVMAVLQKEGIDSLEGARRTLLRLTDDPEKIAALEPALERLFSD